MPGKQRRRKLAAASVSVCMLLQLSPQVVVTAVYTIPSMPDFSYIGAVGSLSAQQTQTAAETVYGALYLHQNEVDFASSGLTMTAGNTDDLISVYRHVSSCYDVGLLVQKGVISYNPFTSTINLSYLFSGSEYDEKFREYSSMLDDILSGVDAAWTDEEKALYLHDYISVKFDYDYPAYYGAVQRPNREQYSSYGMLKNGLAVCEGYSELYAKLMNRLGIRTQLVTSDALSHAWNLVLINGSSYFVDVAWDDSFIGYKGLVKHDNFLKTSEEMLIENHNATDWKDVFGRPLYGLRVPDNFSDAFWTYTNKAIKPYRNGWLAVVGSVKDTRAELFIYDAESHTAKASNFMEPLPFSETAWFVWGSTRSYWTESFTVAETADNIVYYTTPTAVYAYNNGRSIKVYELSNAEKATGDIYGMYSDGERLYYGLDTERHNADKRGEVPIRYSSVKLESIEETVISQSGAPPVATRLTTTTHKTTSPPATSRATTTRRPATTSTTVRSTTTRRPATTSTTARSTTTRRPSTTSTTVRTTTTRRSATTSTTVRSTTTGRPSATSTTEMITSSLTGPATSSKTTTSLPAVTVTFTTLPPSVTRKAGDIDGDGMVNAVDASILLAYYARVSTGDPGGLSDEQKGLADVNGDGLIDAVDASAILSYYSFLSTHTETLSLLDFMDERRKIGI